MFKSPSSSRRFDRDVYNWGGIFDMFGNLAQKKSTDFVSEYEKILPKIERDMQKYLDDIAGLE